MLSEAEKEDFIQAFNTALRTFLDTDDEIVIVDTKISGFSINALVLVRNTGLTGNLIKLIYSLMDRWEKGKKRVKR